MPSKWRESNLWTEFSWKSKQAKSVSLKFSAWNWHREEPSNGCMRNDKGELWFLHRLTIKSISIGNITFQESSDGTGINLSISITAKVTLTLWVLVRIWGLRDEVRYASRSPIWHQVFFHASDLVSQSVKEGDLSRSKGFLGGSRW